MNKVAGVVIGTVLAALTARADVIFSTDFSGASQAVADGPINMGGTVAPEVTVSTLAKGETATFTTFVYDTTDGNGFETAPLFAAARTSQLPNAFDTAQYIEFTLSNISASTLQLDGFSFNLVRKGFQGQAGATLRSSLDSYASNLISFSNDAISGTKSLVSADWSSSPLNLNASGAVTFRIHLWTPTSSAARLGVDDIQITVIPEPATIGMLGLGAGIALFVRRSIRK